MFIAIGDIHGHYDKLESLFYEIRERFDGDLRPHTVVFLGDYVDGGLDTSLCIEFVRDFEEDYPQTVALLGNHEDMLLNNYDDPRNIMTYHLWYNQGGAATVSSYRKLTEGLSEYELALQHRDSRVIPESDIKWMKNLPLLYETKSFYFVHAGLAPDVSLEHNSRTDMLWIRDDFINSDYDWGKRVIFGHTYNKEPVVMKNKIGIDTMMHNRGVLTAVILNDDAPDYFEFLEST